MKIQLKFSLVAIAFLSACTTSVAPNNSGQSNNSVSSKPAVPPLHTGEVAKRLNDCIVRGNQSADALLVDSQIISVSRNNPHAKALFSSSDKLTDLQADALKNYLVQENACRAIALEELSPKMTAIYEEFFKKIDGVYMDLINKKITIGVANQERQLLIQDVYLKRQALAQKPN
jgi:hypothetical protein